MRAVVTVLFGWHGGDYFRSFYDKNARARDINSILAIYVDIL